MPYTLVIRSPDPFGIFLRRAYVAAAVICVELCIRQAVQGRNFYPGRQLSRAVVVELYLVVQPGTVFISKNDIKSIRVLDLCWIQSDVDQNGKISMSADNFVLIDSNQSAVFIILLRSSFLLDELCIVDCVRI